MSDSDNQPDLIDRELIPARSKVSFSREIGEAVVTETLFGKAKVRIIRKDDKWQGILWTAAIIGALAAAVAAWQVWLASQQVAEVTENVTAPAAVQLVDTQPALPPVASTVEATPLPAPTASAVAPSPMAAPHSPLAMKPVTSYPAMLPQSAPRAAIGATGVLPVKPPVAALPPKTLPIRAAASAPAATTVDKPPVAAGGQAPIPPLVSPLSKPAAEPIK